MNNSILPNTTSVPLWIWYPGDFEKGFAINGIPNASAENVMVFQAGTTEKDGAIVTNGGRVLCVTALAGDLNAAVQEARTMMDCISFEGKYYRNDIGYEFVNAPV